MKRVDVSILTFLNEEVITNIIDKYHYSDKQAISEYFESETYRMLIDPEMEVYYFSPIAVFDMWEVEKITGDPRNSAYIRSC